MVGVTSLDYAMLLERITTSIKAPVGFLIPLINQVLSPVVTFNLYFMCMDVELFYFMEYERSEVFSLREIYGPV